MIAVVIRFLGVWKCRKSGELGAKASAGRSEPPLLEDVDKPMAARLDLPNGIGPTAA